MIYLLETFRLALVNLNRYKLRTLLTTSGIIFGIGAVITMMSVGAGARTEIIDQIRRMGITNIIVSTVKPPDEKKAGGAATSFAEAYGLTFRDAEYLRGVLPSARMILPVHRIRKKIYYGNRSLNAKVLGVLPDYFDVSNIRAGTGRLLGIPDGQNGRRVAVVGPGVIREILHAGDPLEVSIRIGPELFRVVGVVDEEQLGPRGEPLLSEGQSLRVYVPYETSLARFGTFSVIRKTGSEEVTRVELEQIVVSCRDVDAVLDTASVMAAALKSAHERRDYEMVVPLEQLQQVKKTQQIFRIVMVLIASISLVVGGIGIANIMFATVTERTREIGIRRALGARRLDIMIQFLCETIVIALLGGLFGCGFGVLGVHLISGLTGWEATMNVNSMVLALFISCIVGVLSGLAPARRAARFDPVASLRHE